MVYQEVWSNAAVGQQEREGWVGEEQKGEDSRADTLQHLHLVTWFTLKHLQTPSEGSMDQHLDRIIVMVAAIQA